MSIPEQHQQLLAKSDFEPNCDSAQFDASEWELIKRFGTWMQGLADGVLEPFTDSQIRFVAVTRGESDPESEYELAWTKLNQVKKQTAEGERQFVTHAQACERCGNSISRERLEVFPNARKCIRCQNLEDSSEFTTDSVDLFCPRCADKGLRSKLVYRQARDPEIRGHFLGCSNFPDCRYTES
jgi:uncharacterized protein YifE (UPF0438 family)